MTKFLPIALCATLGLSGALFPGSSAAETSIPMTVTPTEPVPLLTSPPSGLFKRAGDQIDTLQPGDTYDVQSIQRRQDGIGSVATWVQIAPHGTDAMTDATSGWVFFGTTKAPDQTLFAPADMMVAPSLHLDLHQN